MDIDEILLAHGHKQKIGTDTTPPTPITQFVATTNDAQITLNWVNPTDADFVGLRIQRSTVSYPTSPTDGTTVFNGGGVTFTDINVVNGTKYYYSAFPYDGANNFNMNVSQRVSATPTKTKIYTVIIDTTNSNPETSVTYADDAIGMTAGSNVWDSVFPFSEIKPVMFLNGAVNYYLNPNNFAQKSDGTTADITSGNDGDVMIQFPKFWTYIRKVGNSIYVSLASSKVNANFECLAHTKSGIEKDYSYIASYIGTLISPKMRSVSGADGTFGGTRSEIREAAQSNGVGYQIFSYYQYLMIQILYLIKYKNLNSQAAVGFGVAGSNTSPANGSLNTSGMTFGGSNGVKLFGIENLWGYYYEMIEGLASDSTFNIYTANNNFNNERTGYTNHGAVLVTRYYYDSEYVTNVIGSNSLGFLPTATTNGSESTYFCDSIWLSPDSMFVTGGKWEDNECGIFYVDMWNNSDYGTKNYTCGRLAYL